MNKLSLTVLAVALSGVPLLAQSVRQTPAAVSVDVYRPVGDRRVWGFYARNSRFGELVSTVTGNVKIDGHDASVIEQNLAVDYTKVGAVQNIVTRGEQYISHEGYYLGGKIVFETDGQTDELNLRRQGENLTGYYTRAGQKIPRSVRIDLHTFAWDNNYVDQLELFLALRNLKVGDSIDDTIFLPQPMTSASIKGIVLSYSYQELFSGRSDSVFLIRLSEPQAANLLFTADKRLTGVEFPGYGITILQELVERAEPKPESREVTSPGFSLIRLAAMFPHYLTYLLFGFIALIFFMGGGYRWIDSYLGYFIGGLLFLVTLVTLVPLQNLIVRQWLLPSVAAGESLYFVGVFPALVSGVIQELLKLSAILLLVSWRGSKKYRFAVLGAFCGAGFALAEAGYIVGLTITPLFTWSLLERGFLTVYHVSSGALLGRALSRGHEDTIATLLGLVLMNAMLRYLPIFVHQGVADVHLMYLIYSIIATGVLFFALLRLMKIRSARQI